MTWALRLDRLTSGACYPFTGGISGLPYVDKNQVSISHGAQKRYLKRKFLHRRRADFQVALHLLSRGCK